VLDVGCGYGAPAVAYTRRYHPQSVIGIDITEVRIKTGREHVAKSGLSDVIKLQLGDATKLDFADASFTKLIAVECAFHFDTRRDFLREAGRVLAPGGVLSLTDMIPRRGIDPKAYLKGHPTFYSGFCIDNPGNAYDADVYAQYLRESGFTDIRIESIVDETRLKFADAMEELGKRTPGERGEIFRKGGERLREYITLGEDYVLVVARKK
jgi:microcystin synthetase protein McyJ